MRISFQKIPEVAIPHLNGGEGSVSARMFAAPTTKL